jgi:hypothetical protein
VKSEHLVAEMQRVWQRTSALKARKRHGLYPIRGHRVGTIGVSQWPMEKIRWKEKSSPELLDPELAVFGPTP